MATDREAVTGPMVDPPRPGEPVRYDCLEPLNLTLTRGRQAAGRVAQDSRQPREPARRRVA